MNGWERYKEKCKRFNPNPITRLTLTLVKNYYMDDIRKGMTHSEAVTEIATFLNRPQKIINKIINKGGYKVG